MLKTLLFVTVKFIYHRISHCEMNSPVGISNTVTVL